jgi:5-methylcytosine-specific restriction endonuclease McrA
MKKIVFLLIILLAISSPMDLDAKGRIERSAKARRDFIKTNPCPSTGKSSGSCLGYVVDHIVPLKRGGADHPDNMQWQTKEEAKEKDKRE